MLFSTTVINSNINYFTLERHSNLNSVIHLQYKDYRQDTRQWLFTCPGIIIFLLQTLKSTRCTAYLIPDYYIVSKPKLYFVSQSAAAVRLERLEFLAFNSDTLSIRYRFVPSFQGCKFICFYCERMLSDVQKHQPRCSGFLHYRGSPKGSKVK